MEKIYSFFKLREKNTNIKTELLAGLTIFLTMAYIIPVNPDILSQAGMSFTGVLTATILVASFSSILMGLIANLPYALAPGMGINAFFTYTIVIGMKQTWQTALGAVFVSGLIFLVLNFLKVRKAIVHAIPQCIRFGVAAGIGIFLTFIGLKNAAFIACDPVTYLCMGEFSPQMIIFLLGLLFTLILENKKVKGALLWGIIFTTLISFIPGRLFGNSKDILVSFPDKIVSEPDFTSVFFKLNISDIFTVGMFGVVFTLLFTDMFDSISTFLGVAQVGNLKDKDGEPLNLNKALFVDAVSTTISGLFGSSSGTTYIESASGVEQGGRTGLTAVFTGLLFLPFLYLSPLIQTIPSYATSPALVMVGFFMVKSVKGVKWSYIEEGMPAFLALILIPMTYSITQGISWSILCYVLLKVFNKKYKEVPLMLYIICLFSLLALYLTQV